MGFISSNSPFPDRPGASSAASLLLEVQTRAMATLTWSSILVAPVLVGLTLYNLRAIGDYHWTNWAEIAALLGGPAIQYFASRGTSVKRAAVVFMVWLIFLLTLAYLHIGPFFGNGLGWAVALLVAVFFIGRRAGAVVVGTFLVMAIFQQFAIREGYLAMPRDLMLPGNVSAQHLALTRISFAGFAGLLLLFGVFTLMLRALRKALFEMSEERLRRDTAEAAQQRAEEIMKANQHYEALGKLASGVAHDVNNALTSVLGHAELLRYSLPEGEEQVFAQDIIAAARSAAHTTRQLLTLNRRTFSHPVNVYPNESVETVSRLISRLVPESVQVVVESQSERPILVDPADLQQALLNLVLNARDALPRGGTIKLRISEQPPVAPSTRHTVRIEVSDTGVGIAPGVIHRIFEPFFTTKPMGQGTGLGLAMVRMFVDEAGGQIQVASTVGAGTTVTLAFPESNQTDARLGTAEDGLAAPPAGQRVLVVEDQPELCALMQRVLERGGYAVTMAVSAERALAVLEEPGEFDLLCTDGVIGTVPVHQVVDCFRRKYPQAPVLVCSGHLDDELVRRGVVAREMDLLRKPFSGTELLARVRSSLRAPANVAG